MFVVDPEGHYGSGSRSAFPATQANRDGLDYSLSLHRPRRAVGLVSTMPTRAPNIGAERKTTRMRRITGITQTGARMTTRRGDAHFGFLD